MLGNMTFTAKGRQYLNKAQTGTTINITRVVVGDGTYSGAFADATALQHLVMSLPITRKKVEGAYTQLDALLTNQGLAAGFYIRELGIMATDGTTEILFAYDNAGAEADYIGSEANGPSRQILFRPLLLIGGEANVIVNTSGAIYTTQADFDAHAAAYTAFKTGVDNPAFVPAAALAELTTGEARTSILGKIAKAVSTLISHLADKANPHAVTKAQVGLTRAMVAITGNYHDPKAKADEYTAGELVSYTLDASPVNAPPGAEWSKVTLLYNDGGANKVLLLSTTAGAWWYCNKINGTWYSWSMLNSGGVKSTTNNSVFTFGDGGVAPGTYLLTSSGSNTHFQQTNTNNFMLRNADNVMEAGIRWLGAGNRSGNDSAWVRQDHFPDIPEFINYLQFNTVVR